MCPAERDLDEIEGITPTPPPASAKVLKSGEAKPDADFEVLDGLIKIKDIQARADDIHKMSDRVLGLMLQRAVGRDPGADDTPIPGSSVQPKVKMKEVAIDPATISTPEGIEATARNIADTFLGLPNRDKFQYIRTIQASFREHGENGQKVIDRSMELINDAQKAKQAANQNAQPLLNPAGVKKAVNE